jgi:hypothetical protein
MAVTDQAIEAAFDTLGHEPVSREEMRAAIAAALAATPHPPADAAAKAEMVRSIQDDAWKRGYQACYEGRQRHSPYQAQRVE